MAIRFDSFPQPPARRLGAAAPQGAPEKVAAQLTLGAALKKANETARAFGDSLTAQVDEARKNNAREQVAQIRERIQMLKSLILLFGGSKALLRELKQLAGQLAAAAGVLKENGGEGVALASQTPGTLYTESAPATATGTDSPEAVSQTDRSDDEALAVQAESDLAALSAPQAEPDEQSASDEMDRPTPVFALSSPDPEQAQRRADADLLEKALRELKALFAAAKAARRNGNDRDDQKRLKEIGEDLEQVEKAIGQLRETPSVMVGISVRA
jgi:hypothetical protein